MAQRAKDHPEKGLQSTEIHEILKNERRLKVISLLLEADDLELSVRELSERIANGETGETPPPRDIRQSVYVSLHQSHLPKLDGHRIVDYDMQAKTVQLKDQAMELRQYMDAPPKYGVTWSEFYAGTALVGLVVVIASTIGVPLIASIDPSIWAIALFLLIGSAAAYQTIN